jgi:hypothetical protein
LGKIIEEIQLPESIVPIIILKGKDQIVNLCRTNLVINKGDELLIYVYGSMDEDLSEFGFYDKEVIKL